MPMQILVGVAEYVPFQDGYVGRRGFDFVDRGATCLAMNWLDRNSSLGSQADPIFGPPARPGKAARSWTIHHRTLELRKPEQKESCHFRGNVGPVFGRNVRKLLFCNPR